MADWINIQDRLPEAGQKVDLWIVPKDAEKARRISWTWEKQDSPDLRIDSCKVTHWMPQPEPPKN